MKKLLSTGPGVVIGIPTLGRPVPLDWALAFKAMNPPINFNINFSIVRGKDVAEARNIIAKTAIDSDAKYLFFLGDDVICPPHTLKQLLYRMDQNPSIGVVGGVYCSKCDPPAPLVFRGNGQGSYWDWKIGEFFECTGLGMDATLIRVDILKQMSNPWFKTVDEDQYLDGANKAEQWTEDLYFLNKMANETDYKVFCDGSVICDHCDIYSNPPRFFKLPTDSLPMRKLAISQGRKKQLVVNAPERLGPNDEFVHIYFGDGEHNDYRGTLSYLPFEAKAFDSALVYGSSSLEIDRVAQEVVLV